MKRIENCEIDELVRPVMDGWWCDGGAGRMWHAEEYAVHKICADPARPQAPYSFVLLRNGLGIVFCLNFGRFVVGRLEPIPSLNELATMPQEFWTSGNGQYYDNGPNREMFQWLVKQSEAAGVKVVAARPPRAKSSDRTYVINMASINGASGMSRQATACLSLIIESGKADGISENELAELLRQNGFRLNTKQDPWKIFIFYKKLLQENGILEVREGTPDLQEVREGTE